MFSRLAGLEAKSMVGARGFATAQQLQIRIRSVKNIKKITSAMKMVAACKLRRSQDALDRARVFNQMTKTWPEPNVANESTHLSIGISGDKGLCGGVNSSIVRAVRDHINSQPEGTQQKLIIYGEKAKQGLERMFEKQLVQSCSENGKLVPLEFNQTLEITDLWTNTSYDTASVFYQVFKSMIAYETTEVKFASWEQQSKDLSYFNEYEVEGDSDCLQNLHEFRQAVSLFVMHAENDTSTLSARMAAMDNSTKNAGEMIDKLTVILNRNRQAKITTELSEIIAGAAAVEEV
jgi:F-type H+-transporting ATPase subunit gamma